MSDIAAKCLPNATFLGIRSMTSVPGVNSVQLARLVVRIDDVEQEHLVVNTYPVKPDRVICHSIAIEIQVAYPDAVISFVLGDNPGSADIFAPQSAVASLVGIAGAVSCYKINWGWDESRKFEIKVNGRAIVLQVGNIDRGEW